MSPDSRQEGLRPRVLFVDDEPNILKSIKRELQNSDCDLLLAKSPLDALEILEKARVDLVVTDVQMPEMDGIEFLRIVKDKHPNIHRIILSGFVEQSYVVGAITKGYATAYLAKPWEKAVLRSSIQHFLELRRMLNRRELRNTLNSIEDLPSLPSLYQEFARAVAEDKPANEIASIIDQDVVLSARILHLANSAFYGTVSVSDVERAIVRLGLNAIKDLVMAFSFINSIDWHPDQVDKLHDIIRHSTLVNKFLKKVHGIKHNAPLKQEYASVGITHDIGKIVLLHYFPNRYDAILENSAQSPGMSFHESELQLGFQENTHCEIGAYFLNMWSLPSVMVDAAMNHHEPKPEAQPFGTVVAALHCTDLLLEHLDRLREGDGELPAYVRAYLSEEELGELKLELLAETRAPSTAI